MRMMIAGSLGLMLGSGCERAPVDVLGLAEQCMTVRVGPRVVQASTGNAYSVGRGAAARFSMTAADLGVYLLHDADGGYLVGNEDGSLARQTRLQSDVTERIDGYVSAGEWQVEPASPGRVWLRNRRSGAVLQVDGEDAEVRLVSTDGCVSAPELSLDATGTPGRTTFEDGDLYGIVDSHAHIMSNWGFGGGGIFHGAPFHRLGVEHALPDCTVSHGPAGRTDFIGAAFDGGGADGASVTAVLGALLNGELSEDNHVTDGYPEFTEWPDAVRRATHQTEYYRWLERAYLAGLRLVMQHATSNAVLCELSAGSADLYTRYGCDDMVSIDRSIDEVYAMERYIDARSGGPGLGWFRVVTSPQDAREVIRAGKLAVILGIEVSDLFECRLVPRADGPVCDEAYVQSQLDAYHARGVRALFPVHKYDNQFSAGDGDRNFIELGNFLNSGHWSSFVTGDCPDVPSSFDRGDVGFGGLNRPRKDFLAPPPNDMSGFADDPLGTSLPFLGNLTAPALEGDYCQAHGLTDLGRYLIDQMMQRGMIVEIDHLPRRSYVEAFQMLEDAEYPAVGTHGNTFDDRLYDIGGVSKTRVGRCRDPERSGALLDSMVRRVDAIRARGGYPAEGFGFDLNGFAGARGGRFEPGACDDPQTDGIVYPFTSWAGDVTFTEPWVGNRRIDFDQEGMVHIGLLPELLQDARIDAASDEDLEPLFRSAEGYLRMWERAESRGAALRAR